MRSGLTVVLIFEFLRLNKAHPAQCVQHGKFGEGVVLKFEGAGDSARVQINFSNAGTKWLVVSFANLQAG